MLHKSYMLTEICLIMALSTAAPCKGQEPDAAIDALRKAVKEEISAEEEAPRKDEVFTSGALGLQRLNPEISVTGDILWSYGDTENNSVLMVDGNDLNFEGV